MTWPRPARDAGGTKPRTRGVVASRGQSARAARQRRREELMVHQREQSVRVRAYELWEEAGHTGSPEEHWFRAEHELGCSGEINRGKQLSRPGTNQGAFVA